MYAHFLECCKSIHKNVLKYAAVLGFIYLFINNKLTTLFLHIYN